MSLTVLYMFLVILPNIHLLASQAIPPADAMLIVFGGFGYIMANAENSEWGIKASKLCLKIGFPCLILCGIFTSLTPSDEQIYKIAGAYVATNAKDVEKLPDNLVKAANAWLQKVAKEADDKVTK